MIAIENTVEQDEFRTGEVHVKGALTHKSTMDQKEHHLNLVQQYENNYEQCLTYNANHFRPIMLVELGCLPCFSKLH